MGFNEPWPDGEVMLYDTFGESDMKYIVVVQFARGTIEYAPAWLDIFDITFRELKKLALQYGCVIQNCNVYVSDKEKALQLVDILNARLLINKMSVKKVIGFYSN